MIDIFNYETFEIEEFSIFFERRWNLVEINVTRDELENELKTQIPHLVYPLTSVLDESVGSVLWFGARGHGQVDGIDYSTNCRV